MTTKYVRKPVEIEAVQITDAMMQGRMELSLPEWAAPGLIYQRDEMLSGRVYRIEILVRDSYHMVEAGFWLVNELHDVIAVHPDVFKQRYDECVPRTVSDA